MVLMSHNTDIADGWEREGENPEFFEMFSPGGYAVGMNVVIWARVSSREQREGYSIDAQLRANRQRAQANGWHVTREFVVAESAKRGAERKTFHEMFAWVKANAKPTSNVENAGEGFTDSSRFSAPMLF